MKRILGQILFCLLVAFVLAVGSTNAQWIYGSSQLGYDSVNEEVFSYSRTWVDAYVGLDHDPEVDGFLYRINSQVASGTHTGWAQYVAARVELETLALPSTQYTIISDHWIKRVTYTTVTVGGENYTYWWDPWGFSTFSPVYGTNYPGFPYYQWVGPRWTYLGWTAVSGITPPDSCELPALPPEGGILLFKGEDPAVPCPTPTPSPTVTAEISSVGFSGSGKHEVFRYVAPAPPPIPVQINNPTWVRGATDNDANRVAYTKGTSGMKLQGAMSLTPSVPSGTSIPAKIRVKKGSTTVISEIKSVSLTGSSVNVNDITINSSELESTPKAKRSNYNFRWEISFDDGATWRHMGDSGPHPVYWTYADPTATKFKNFNGGTYNHLFDLALEKAAVSLGAGETSEREIVKKLTSAIDSELIYNPGESASNSTHPMASYSVGNAQCSGNANLLSGLLRSIGIDASTYYYHGGDPSSSRIHFYRYLLGFDASGNPIEAFPSFQVTRETSAEGTPTVPLGNVKRNPHFTFHAMTKVPSLINKRYDPSYGKEYDGVNFVAKEVADFTSTVPRFKFDSDTVSNILEGQNWPLNETIHSSWTCTHRGLAGFVARNFPSFDDDEVADLVVWRPSDGVWYASRSSDGSASFTAFGVSTDTITPGDYDGDGYGDPAVYRPNEGRWYVLRSSDANMQTATFGVASDKPVQGDYDSDGKTDFAVWRPSDGVWHVLGSSTGYFATQFGVNGDKPVFGDYDGDAKTDIAVWRPSNGVWYILNSSSGTYTFAQFGPFGPDSIPVPGDYDNDGKTDLATWNSDDGIWHVLPTNGAYWTSSFGSKNFGDKAVPSDYDGDGKTDIAIWRSSNGQWWIRRSSDQAIEARQWGIGQDIPIQVR